MRWIVKTRHSHIVSSVRTLLLARQKIKWEKHALNPKVCWTICLVEHMIRWQKSLTPSARRTKLFLIRLRKICRAPFIGKCSGWITWVHTMNRLQARILVGRIVGQIIFQHIPNCRARPLNLLGLWQSIVYTKVSKNSRPLRWRYDMDILQSSKCKNRFARENFQTVSKHRPVIDIFILCHEGSHFHTHLVRTRKVLRTSITFECTVKIVNKQSRSA